MVPPKMLIPLLAALLTGACVTGTGSTADPDPGPTDGPAAFPASETRIEYRFNDSSVPPEYHRSRTVTVDADTTEIVIDSYGDEIARDRVDTDPDRWEAFLADLEDDLGALPEPDDVDDGCTGGTSNTLRIVVADETRFERTSARCGGDGVEAAAAIDRLVSPLLVDLDPREGEAPGDSATPDGQG